MNVGLYKIRLFRLHRILDWITILALVALAFPLALIIFLPLVFLAPAQDLIFGKRFKRSVAHNLRKQWSIPWFMRIRRSQKGDFQVNSALFFSVLLVPNAIAEKPDNTLAQLKIAHELGHHSRMDLPVYYLFVGAISLILLWMIEISLQLWSVGSSLFPLEYGWFVLVPLEYGWFVLGVLASGVIFGLLDIRRCMNFRELNADDFAVKQLGSSFNELLDHMQFIRQFRPKSMQWPEWLSDALHPSPGTRKKFIDTPGVHNGQTIFSWLKPLLTAAIALLYLNINLWDCLELQSWTPIIFIDSIFITSMYNKVSINSFTQGYSILLIGLIGAAFLQYVGLQRAKVS